ncbi:MAG: hypothetical protein DMG72_24525 [Acidobacteria bacterium]|nr:MAG: hypothetical protein DMG72_24525 [Acidobacteriota bacterium]
MAIQKPEWFKMDPAKFLSDVQVDGMSTAELGACFRLLCRQWLDGHIPDDLHLLARLCRLDATGMDEAWVTLSQFFPVVEPGKRANRFMWIEREKVVADLERRSDDGTRAARKRWNEARKQPDATPIGSPMPHPMQDQSRPEQSRAEKRERTTPPTAKRASQIPQDFHPKDSHHALAVELGVNLDAAFAKFMDHHGSKGSTYKNWDLAFNSWLRKEQEFTRGNGRRGVIAGQSQSSDYWKKGIFTDNPATRALAQMEGIK